MAAIGTRARPPEPCQGWLFTAALLPCGRRLQVWQRAEGGPRASAWRLGYCARLSANGLTGARMRARAQAVAACSSVVPDRRSCHAHAHAHPLVTCSPCNPYSPMQLLGGLSVRLHERYLLGASTESELRRGQKGRRPAQISSFCWLSCGPRAVPCSCGCCFLLTSTNHVRCPHRVLICRECRASCKATRASAMAWPRSAGPTTSEYRKTGTLGKSATVRAMRSRW